MRILHFVLILAFAILLKYVYWDSSNPLPNSPLNYLSSLQQAPPPDQVTFYILAAQWPPGVCTGKSGVTCKINPVPTEFTIHGLWPKPDGAPSPPDPFEASEISMLTSQLKNNWPDLKSKQPSVGENIQFWQKEWNKHGTYSDLGVYDYFKKTIDLHKDACQGLKAKLVAKGIIPNNYNTYKLVDIQAAVKKINGGSSCTVRCVTSKVGNVPQIQEIRFSYKKNFDKQDNLERSNCGADVRFPE